MRGFDTSGITRRRFLSGLGMAVTSLIAACRRGAQATTAVPSATAVAAQPAPTPRPLPTITVAAAASPTVVASPSPSATPSQVADFVLRNGKIITVDRADRIVQAIALKNDVIQAVGSDAEMAPLIGAATQVVDLAGRAVTPGLVDPHNHLQVLGLMESSYTSLLPPEVRAMKDLQTKLAGVAAKTPKGQWIQGYFLALSEGRLPNRQDLDEASRDHPIWLLQQGGHYGSANSIALQIAGITGKTPNPVGGVIERDGQGNPTGVFYNHRAMDVLRRSMPPYTPEMARENIISSQTPFLAAGVTSLQDVNVRGVANIDTYLEVGRQGKMVLRGAVYYTLEWPQDLDRALKELKRYDDKFMRFAGYKFLIDGQAQMAYTREPHNGVRWDLPTWDAPTFKKAVRALHDTGLQICVHCIGDAAVDLTLDAYEEAMEANPRPDPRHRIEHCVLCARDSIKRMRDLGVVVSTNPTFIRVGGDYWATIFGQQRTRRAIVTRDWLKGGVALAIGSDAPTTPWLTPQATLAAALARVTVSKKVLEPEQALTIQEALRAHTMGSAYAAHEEKVKGSLEVGKLADLAVWAEDPYKLTPDRLFQAGIEMTLVGGKIVHQSANSALKPRPGR